MIRAIVQNVRTVTVEFPDGPREIIPSAWQTPMFCLRDTRPAPIFDVPNYTVVSTVDGRYVAIRDDTVITKGYDNHGDSY